MKNISIFAKPPYVIRHLQRVSSIIRGEQMAAYMLNARLNPASGYENDVCIYVKPHVPVNEDFKFEGDAYLDILDGYGLVPVLQKHPEVPVIVFSDLDVETLSRVVKNKIICIPHHHVNFDRIKRERNKVKKVGIIGTEFAFQQVPNEIKEGLAKRNMQYLEYSTFYPRQSVVDWYRQIDLCLVWRPYQKHLSNPFKIVNAGSFGVPSICLDEPAFKEVEGCYMPVNSLEEFFKTLDEVRTMPEMYQHYADKCLEKMEEYHIENIAKKYQALCQ